MTFPRPYNIWFLVPFMAWVVVGVALHFIFGKTLLFVYINGNYSDMMNTLMYYTTYMGTAQFIVPVLMIPLLSKRYRHRWYLAYATACSIIPMMALHTMKVLFAKPRPMHYYEGTPWVHILPHWDRMFENSFPSGHTEGAFSLFCFLSIILPRRFRMVGTLFFIVALAVGYSRIYLTAHFFEDVYAGSIVGVFFTILAYEWMHRFIHPKYGDKLTNPQ